MKYSFKVELVAGGDMEYTATEAVSLPNPIIGASMQPVAAANVKTAGASNALSATQVAFVLDDASAVSGARIYYSKKLRSTSPKPVSSVPARWYLFSFVVGFVFGELLDVHELWINVLPTAIGWRIFYFIVSYILICIGIAISNRCKMPIVPTDLFPRELSQITSVAYPKIKISFDVICLIVTAALTGFGLGHIKGLGIGTVVAAFTMGKGVGIAGNWLDKHMDFTSFLAK